VSICSDSQTGLKTL